MLLISYLRKKAYGICMSPTLMLNKIKHDHSSVVYVVLDLRHE